MFNRINPEPPRCAWCDRRIKPRDLHSHEEQHRLADLAMREAARTLKDSRAMAERLAEAAEHGNEFTTMEKMNG